MFQGKNIEQAQKTNTCTTTFFSFRLGGLQQILFHFFHKKREEALVRISVIVHYGVAKISAKIVKSARKKTTTSNVRPNFISYVPFYNILFVSLDEYA